MPISTRFLTAIHCLTNKSWGLGWSPRRITVSTAGLAARLKDVAALGVNLAISLNGTTEEQRQRLMPAVSQIASLKTLMAACRRYPLAPTRRLTFEYVLLAGVNDRDEDAHRLVKLLKGLRCKVNLIPFNEFPGNAFRRPTDRSVAGIPDYPHACRHRRLHSQEPRTRRPRRLRPIGQSLTRIRRTCLDTN